ncbi:hypothetical protein [Streptomyces sp. NPDC004065]|uniref:hypothetical protein n=1 Tax=Streptomyces sp. NPDC004065 TaxID=3364689 RepID=UPI00384BB5B9
MAAAAAVVGAGAAAGVLQLTGGDDSDTARTAATARPGTSAPAPSPPATDGAPGGGAGGDGTGGQASGSPSASAPPEGYRVVADPAGFTLAVPDGWQRSERATGVFYSTDGDHRLLQVFVVTEAGMTPYEAVRQSSANLSRQPAYEEISLDEAASPDGVSSEVGGDAARLVYAYDSDKLGERRQVVEYAFTAGDGRKYAVLAAGPAAEWPRAQRDADTALAFFTTR